VQYWEIVTRSFRISWRHKYLWLIALFSGESGGGFNSSYQQGLPNRGGTSAGNGAAYYGDAVASAGRWLNDHIGLILLLAGLVVLIWIALFVLAAVCEGATVRASAEHDAERQFGLGWAWQAGRNTMWAIIRLRLLIFVLLLPGLVVVGLAAVGFIVAIANGGGGASVGLGLLLGLLVLAFIPYAIYVGFLDRLGTRAVVLELVGARAALGRGHRLVRNRLGRVLLVWLLSIAIAIALGIALGIAILVVAIPLIVGIIALGTAGSGFAVVLVIIGVLVLLPVSLVLGGFLAAQSSTYWTLAFRRLDLDQAPAYQYPYYPPAQPGPAAPPQGTPTA
jgi:hypothetical protein